MVHSHHSQQSKVTLQTAEPMTQNLCIGQVFFLIYFLYFKTFIHEFVGVHVQRKGKKLWCFKHKHECEPCYCVIYIYIYIWEAFSSFTIVSWLSPSPNLRAKLHNACVVDSTLIASLYEKRWFCTKCFFVSTARITWVVIIATGKINNEK